MTRPTGNPSDELVDVLDDDGAIVGQATRAEIRAGNLWHRTVFVMVVSTDGRRLLVHQRADWKDVWPSRWDVGFGGLLDVGETFDDAARRELGEEAGLTGLPDEAFELLGDGRYADDEVREIAAVYRVRSDGPFTFPDGEVVASEWMDLADIDLWLHGPPPRPVCPDSVAVALPFVI